MKKTTFEYNNALNLSTIDKVKKFLEEYDMNAECVLYGDTLLDIMAIYSRFKIVKFLIDNGAKPKKNTRRPLLHSLAKVRCNIDILKGEILGSIYIDQDRTQIIFTTINGDQYLMYHAQDCCEGVWIEEITGDLNDLVGSPLLLAEESTNSGDLEGGTYTWTFYKFATINGYVTVRWYGSSNGFYSEAVSFAQGVSGSKELIDYIANIDKWTSVI
jgi:hypothetical protein